MLRSASTWTIRHGFVPYWSIIWGGSAAEDGPRSEVCAGPHEENALLRGLQCVYPEEQRIFQQDTPKCIGSDTEECQKAGNEGRNGAGDKSGKAADVQIVPGASRGRETGRVFKGCYRRGVSEEAV